jgi:hypothetical protein
MKTGGGTADTRMVEKDTKNEDASSEYGSWSNEGTEMFNMLGGIVEDNRKRRNARDAEEWVLESLREQVGGGARIRNTREMDPSALQRAVDKSTQDQCIHRVVDSSQLIESTAIEYSFTSENCTDCCKLMILLHKK